MSNLQWRVGDAQVTQIIEAPAGSILAQLMGDATPELLASMPGMKPHFVDADGNMRGWFQSFLVTVDSKHILIEGGIGNDRYRSAFPGMHLLQTNFLDQFAALGVAVADIDFVISSHLHIDHVGWFTRPENDAWVPTFPNARYIIVRDEYDFWVNRQAHPDQMAAFQECVAPVVEAGVVDFVDVDFQLNDTITLVPLTGHTPYHVGIQLTSAGQTALFAGDVFPHPSVILNTRLQFGSDADPEQAVQTRDDLLAQLADTDTILFSPHFADPVTTRIVRTDEGYGFEAS